MKRVGFVWHSLSTGNLGVGALSVSNLLIVSEILKNAGIGAEFIIFGPKSVTDAVPIPELPAWRYVSLSYDTLLGHGPFHLLKELNSCDLVLDIGSGDSFSDIYGKKRFLKILLSKLMIRGAAHKLVLSPQTIGPFNNTLYRRLAAFAMGRSMKVFVRDRQSFTYAESISRGSVNLDLSTDVAMAMPWRTIATPGLVHGDGTINVGLNVSGLLYSGGYTGGNQFGLAVDYRQEMHDLVSEFSSQPNVQIWMVPHVLTTGGMQPEDDFFASQAIAKEMPTVRVAPKFIDPIEAKSFIAQMDFFIGARMHATIAAFSSGVPVIPLAYSRKFAGLYESLGYMRVIDMRNAQSLSLIETVMEAFRERDVLRMEVADAFLRAQTALDSYRKYLRECLTGKEVKAI